MATLDPRLRQAILSQAGGDQELATVLAATALAESGGRLNAVGDSGHSYGPYQENDRGRGAGIDPRDRQDPVASTRRAIQEFNRFRTSDPGQWASDAQRPADRAGYRTRINSLLDEARRQLGTGTPVQRARVGLAGERQGPQPPASQTTQADTLATALLRRPPGQSLFRTVLADAMSSPPPQPQVATEQPPSAQPQPGQDAPQTGARVLGRDWQQIGTPHAGTHTLGNWQSDNAVDLRVPENTPVYSLFPGTIGPNIGPLGNNNPRFAGERLTVQGQNNAAYYAHLSRILVRAGQRVRRGQLLGYSGSANGVPHLHLGVQSGDPRQIIGG